MAKSEVFVVEDEKEKTRIFHYLDALPGAGKTEYFVNLAEQHIVEKKNHILMYVAPTRILLTETFNRLAARDVDLSRVFVVTDNRSVDLDSVSGGVWPKDAPAAALNYLLGLTPEEEYASAIYARGYQKECEATLQPGDIVLTTHEAFLRVHLSDRTGKDFALLRKCHVVFDEARKCIIATKTFGFHAHDWLALSRGMRGRMAHQSKGWGLAEVTRIDDLPALATYFNVDKVSRIPQGVRELKALYDMYVRRGRASMYLLSVGSHSIFELTDVKNPKITMNITLRPISLFAHYGRVTLVSAFLTDSQMYHFLRKDGHEFVNLMSKPPAKDHMLRPVYERNIKLKDNIGTRLQVAPILESGAEDDLYLTAGQYRDNLTAHLLQKKFVVPREFNQVSLNADENDYSYIPKGYRVPPLWVMLREAAKIFHKWKADNPHAETALLTVNAASNTRKWRDVVRHLKVVRSVLRYGLLYQETATGKSYGDDNQLSPAEEEDIAFTDPRWVEFFRKILYRKSKQKLFVMPKSPNLQGLNSFSHMHAFVHLAALNPTPDLVKLYRVLLGDYDIDLDHSIDNLVQMLYRTNLRDPKGSEPVLLITAYSAVADMLAAKLKVSRFTRVHTPRLKAWAHTTEQTKERHRQGCSRGGQVRKYKPEYAKKIKNVQIYISQVNTKLKQGKSLRLELRLAELQQRLKKLQIEGALNRK